MVVDLAHHREPDRKLVDSAFSWQRSDLRFNGSPEDAGWTSVDDRQTIGAPLQEQGIAVFCLQRFEAERHRAFPIRTAGRAGHPRARLLESSVRVRGPSRSCRGYA